MKTTMADIEDVVGSHGEHTDGHYEIRSEKSPRWVRVLHVPDPGLHPVEYTLIDADGLDEALDTPTGYPERIAAVQDAEAVLAWVLGELR